MKTDQSKSPHWLRLSRRNVITLGSGLCVVAAVIGFAVSQSRSANITYAIDSPQWVTVQIVSAPTRSVSGGIEYDEAAVKVHSTHEIPLSPSPQSQTVRSTADGLPLVLVFSGIEKAPAKDGIVLKDLEVHLPMRVRKSKNSSVHSLFYFSSDTHIPNTFADFTRASGLTIHYVPETTRHTFVRMKVSDAQESRPILDLSQ